ncbi:CLUMA_CG018795, isoform A [Clunio marinus]|uniref:CLUMA_CG018795, isoform A n=1 Tax=Clunio marinus TaxID=568069 RepID=A0A1J1J049_9DIPT|nr:CLUMA_CG018795, isoform A [Clunio marinus]
MLISSKGPSHEKIRVLKDRTLNRFLRRSHDFKYLRRQLLLILTNSRVIQEELKKQKCLKWQKLESVEMFSFFLFDWSSLKLSTMELNFKLKTV